MRRHWYFISLFVCPICGRTIEYRERRFGRKPKRGTHKIVDDYCGCLG